MPPHIEKFYVMVTKILSVVKNIIYLLLVVISYV